MTLTDEELERAYRRGLEVTDALRDVTSLERGAEYKLLAASLELEAREVRAELEARREHYSKRRTAGARKTVALANERLRDLNAPPVVTPVKMARDIPHGNMRNLAVAILTQAAKDAEEGSAQACFWLAYGSDMFVELLELPKEAILKKADKWKTKTKKTSYGSLTAA